MARFIVDGGTPLRGSITPAGNKNEALPLVAAALLTDEPVTLENVPRIRDIESLLSLVRAAGASAEWTAANTLVIHAKADDEMSDPSGNSGDRIACAEIAPPQ